MSTARVGARSLIAVAVGLLGAFVSERPARAAQPLVAVTACGQVVDRGGYLVADLDCSSSLAQYGVVLDGTGKGTLDLRGFTIVGPPSASSAAVRCERSCDIVGNGGAISGGWWGVAGVRRVTLYDTTVTDSVLRGVDGGSATRLYNVAISGVGKEAVTGRRQLLSGCTITSNGDGIEPAIPAVHGDRVRVLDSIVTGNQGVGVEGVKIRVKDSDVSGNGLAPECGTTHNCNYDLGSFLKPRVIDTACSQSFDSRACGGCNGHVPLTDDTNPALHNWGVCSLD